MAEAGLPGYETTIWLGIMAPAGTPTAVVEKLNAEINKIVRNPEVKAEWSKQGAESMSMTAEEFVQFVREDIAKWAKVVQVSGAKAD